MSALHILFSHGLDGSQWGLKIKAMAEVARRYQLAVDSIDYANLETAARVQRLLEVCRALSGEVILVGSSLGAHVATTVSTQVPTRGLYLLAPAFFMPGFEQYTPEPAQCPVTIVHGWNDDVVPVDNSIRFARQHRATLHVVDGDHRLHSNVDEVREFLDRFLRRLGVPARD